MRKKIVSKEDIVRQGLLIIEKEGIDKCTVRSISKKMGIGVGTIYNYFESFDALILEAFNTSWYETQMRVDKIAKSEKTAYQRLIDIFDITLEDVKKRNNLGEKLYMMFLGSSKPYFEKLHDSYVSVVIRIISEVEPSEKKEALAYWIVVILFDHVTKKVPLTEGERQLLKALIP